jgi:glycosyltransferase involved in cell wall biosynthesis
VVKVIHIITRLDMGGSAQNTLDTCLNLNHSKYDVYLIHGLSLESEMTQKERSTVAKRIAKAKLRGVKVITLDTLVRQIDIIKDLKTFFSLWRIMRHAKPIIVHTHTSKAGLLGRLSAWFAGIPLIVQTPHGHVFYGHFGSLGSKFFLLLEKLAARLTDRLVALTEQERMDYVKFAVAPSSKLLTIHSGVKLDRYLNGQFDEIRKREFLGFTEHDLVIGFVGWLLPIKGVMHLLKAMEIICNKYPHARLVYVGKGELEKDLKAETERLGLTANVKFLGWRDDVEKIMPLFDIFVLPSLNEGMGRVLVEAMAAARPVVASEVGGIPDLVKPGENGILVPPGNTQALAAGIMQLIDQPKKAKKMGQLGRRLSRNYMLETMIQKIEDLYEELLNKGPLVRNHYGIENSDNPVPMKN